MSKRAISLYLILVCLVFVAFFSVSLTLNQMLNTQDQPLIQLRAYDFKGKQEVLYERTLPLYEEGVYRYSATFDDGLLKASQDDYALVITRLRGVWHRIFLNGELIGTVGRPGINRVHIWNGVYQFNISRDKILATNTLTFETYSDYKIGFGTVPPFIADSVLSDRLFFGLKLVSSDFYLFIFGMLLAVSVLEILIFFMMSTNRRRLLYPLSVLFIAFYLLDYVVMPHPIFTRLLYKKLVVSMLYASAFAMGEALYHRYKKPIIRSVNITILVMYGWVFLIAKDLIQLSVMYRFLNLALIMMVMLWTYTAYKSYRHTHDAFDFLIAIACVLLAVPGLVDTATLIVMDGSFTRVGVLGFIAFGFAIIVATMMQFVSEQRAMVVTTKELSSQTEILKHALITDDLTGLYNHRHFYETYMALLNEGHKQLTLLHIDIDHFKSINEVNGHSSGDAILQMMGKLLQHLLDPETPVFRYGGGEFVVITLTGDEGPLRDLAKKIKQAIMTDPGIQSYAGYLPVTVSVGISHKCKDAHHAKANIEKAIKATKYAKMKGYNQICFYSEDIDRFIGNPSVQTVKDQMLLGFVYTLAGAVDLKDPYTGKHSEEVAMYAMLVAEEMQLSPEVIMALRIGGLLHDFGKLAIPDAIIRKEGRLTDEEYTIIKTHPAAGYSLIKQIIEDEDVVSCVRSHHERFDGSGYPDGKKGDEIPLLARIICVCDAYHAMISNRSYRKALTEEEAMVELIKHQGTQFDASVVFAFRHVISRRNQHIELKSSEI